MKPLVVLLLVASLLFSCAPAQETATRGKLSEGLEPSSRPDGSPWRIAVLQSGDYSFYNDVLTSLHSGLAELGWSSVAPAKTSTENDTIPALLARWQTQSGHVLFDPSLFADLGFS